MDLPGQRGSAPRFVWIFFLVFVCLAIGCGKSNRPQEAVPPLKEKPSTDARPLNALPPGYSTDVNEEEAVAFARELERAVAENDLDAVNRLIDWEMIADRICERLPFYENAILKIREGTLRGIIGSPASGKGLVPTMLRQVAEGGSYRFVRSTEENGMRGVLFRMVGSDGSFTYVSYPLAHAPSDNVIASDMYVYLAAEYLTQSMYRMLLSGMIDSPDSPSGGNVRTAEEIGKHKRILTTLLAAEREGRFEDALRLYRDLPTELQRSKSVLIRRIGAAQNVDEKEYQTALEQYHELYPHDASLALLMITCHAARNEFDKALEAVDTLDAHVQDSYLNLHRASLYLEKKDIASARRCLDRFLADFPDDIEGHGLQIAIAMEQGDFSAVTKILKLYDSDFGVDLELELEDPFYAPYKKSDEYKKLLKYLEEQPKNPEPTTRNPRP